MMVRTALLILLTLAARASEGPTVYVGDRSEHRIQAVATDTSGNTYVAGSRVVNMATAEPFVAKLDPANNRLWIRYFPGNGSGAGTAVAADRDGNVYLAGSTTSTNLALRSPLQATPGGGFLSQLAANGEVLWTSYYGATSTGLTSVAAASDGTLVVGGSTTTNGPSALQTAFAAKIEVTAGRVVWEQRFTGTQVACSGGSSCFLSARGSDTRIALDAVGNVYAGGNTNTTDFPTTTGAYLPTGYGPYLRKFSPNGTLLWSTYLSNSREGVGTIAFPSDTLTGLFVGPDGGVYVTGNARGNWKTTPGAYQSTYNGSGRPIPYAAKINSTGTALMYSTFLGHPFGTATAITVNNVGIATVGGTEDFLTTLNTAGTAVVSDVTYPLGARGAGIVVDAKGVLHAAGPLGIVTNIEQSTPPSGMAGVANAAGGPINGRIAPGELISIYGWSLGEQVFLDELPMPVLYASATQINAVVPFATGARERAVLTVRRAGNEVARAVVALTPALPEVFRTATGSAAALNQDGTVNSENHPAEAGSVVSIWGTGAPNWPAGSREGTANPTDRLILLPLEASVNSLTPSGATLFAGAAPGLPAGVFQINLRLPATSGPQSVYVLAGGESSAPVTVYVAR